MHPAAVEPARADVPQPGRDQPAGPLVGVDEHELRGPGGDLQDPDRQRLLGRVPPGLPAGPGGHVLDHEHPAGGQRRGTGLQQRPLRRLVEQVEHVHEDDGVPRARPGPRRSRRPRSPAGRRRAARPPRATAILSASMSTPSTCRPGRPLGEVAAEQPVPAAHLEHPARGRQHVDDRRERAASSQRTRTCSRSPRGAVPVGAQRRPGRRRPASGSRGRRHVGEGAQPPAQPLDQRPGRRRGEHGQLIGPAVAPVEPGQVGLPGLAGVGVDLGRRRACGGQLPQGRRRTGSPSRCPASSRPA